MTAGLYDMRIEKGADFNKSLYLKDSSNVVVPLIGYTARMQARKDSSASTPFIDITTENGGIVINGPNGHITLKLTNIETSAIAEFMGLYDLEIIDSGGIVTRLLSGSVIIIGEQTR